MEEVCCIDCINKIYCLEFCHIETFYGAAEVYCVNCPCKNCYCLESDDKIPMESRPCYEKSI